MQKTLTSKITTIKIGDKTVSLPEFWDTDDFIKVPPYYNNRATERRIPRLKKNLKVFTEEHIHVSIGRVCTPFHNLPVGTLFRLNGNARADFWTENPESKPSHVIVKIQDLHTENEAELAYRSYDSPDSVETSSDVLTGILRDVGYTAKTEYIRKGKFKSVMNRAGQYVRFIDSDGKLKSLRSMNDIQGKSDTRAYFEYFKEVLYKFDEHPELFRKKGKVSMNVLISLLMVGKKYGANHPRFTTLIKNFCNETVEYIDGDSMDGVYFTFNKLFSQYHERWTSGQHSEYTQKSDNFLPKIIYAFSMFMESQTIDMYKARVIQKKWFQNYWETYLDARN